MSTATPHAHARQYAARGQPASAAAYPTTTPAANRGSAHANAMAMRMVPMVMPATAPTIPRKRAFAESDYANRVRMLPNGLVVPSSFAKEEPDVDVDDLSDDDVDVARPRRAAAKAAQLSFHDTPSSASTPRGSTLAGPPALSAKRARRHTNYLTVHAYTPAQRAAAADLRELLIPIKLELDLDGYKLRDLFVWNVREAMVSPEKFAEIMCTDLGLAAKFVPIIAMSIRNQIDECVELGAELVDDVAWDEPLVVEIEVLIGRVLVRDRFEWDPQSTLTPEQFARTTCADLGLAGEYVPLLAAATRDAIHRQLRDRLHGHMAPPPARVPPIHRPARDADEWAPTLDVLDAGDLEKHASKDERESRRARRETARAAHAATRRKWSAVTASVEEMRKLENAIELATQLAHPVTAATVVAATKMAVGGAAGAGVMATAPPVPTARSRATANAAATPRATPARLNRSSAPATGGLTTAAASPAPSRRDRGPRFATELPPPVTNRLIKGLSLVDQEQWRCAHCGIDATRTLSIRRGPTGPRSLCNACGIRYSTDGMLPLQRQGRYTALYHRKSATSSAAASAAASSSSLAPAPLTTAAAAPSLVPATATGESTNMRAAETSA
ncbi:hypothetical protein AMAG_14615 [Allomyces macrogynus ATCC 38327]|uniref:GATA-type domain-containing protein n=1 Tax=Allomyces macrogynus (strain ATCC 38327) TaxID=578462 RepID=A0A0L0T737_ALLM3|nr:hypothetical protein AMAG_14615 [Allomyces macrogynus ATCC 38327]|eukprot:KNE70491.1 hypothetical protein AMAG_14615 [Allomyces macrogynus ATCC 38327]